MSAVDDPKGDPKDKHDELPEEEAPDSASLRELLRAASKVPPPAPRTDVLRGVQRRIRQRSAGKFYADGWSTREESPRATYLVTAAVMLIVVVVLYLALAPGGVGRPLRPIKARRG